MNIIQVVVTFVLVGATVFSEAVVHDELTVSGVTCKYSEYKKSGSGPRGIRICSCKNDQGSIAKSCLYYGANPHHCGNDYNNNHEAYYRALAVSAMENGAPCAKPSISETICNLEYPCYEGSCFGSRRRRAVRVHTCPEV